MPTCSPSRHPLAVRRVARNAFIFWGLLLSLTLSTSLAGAEDLKFRVMTFNVKYASERGENTWRERRPILKRAIEMEAPDIIGTQENLFRQILTWNGHKA